MYQKSRMRRDNLQPSYFKNRRLPLPVLRERAEVRVLAPWNTVRHAKTPHPNPSPRSTGARGYALNGLHADLVTLHDVAPAVLRFQDQLDRFPHGAATAGQRRDVMGS